MKIIESEKMRKCKNGKKRREFPHGGWGMGSKEPIQKYFYYKWLQYQQNDMIPLGSYTK